MDITQDIQALTTFRNNSLKILRQLQDTKRPVVLTANGKPIAVLQDPASYQRLLDIAAGGNASEAVRPGLDEAVAGSIRPAKAGFDVFRGKYNVPRRGSQADDLRS